MGSDVDTKKLRPSKSSHRKKCSLAEIRDSQATVTIQLEPTSSNPLASTDAGIFLGDSNVVTFQNQTIPLVADKSGINTYCVSLEVADVSHSISVDAENGVHDLSASYVSESRLAEPNSVLPPETQTGTVLPSQNLAIKPLSFKELAQTAEGMLEVLKMNGLECLKTG